MNTDEEAALEAAYQYLLDHIDQCPALAKLPLYDALELLIEYAAKEAQS